MINTSIVATLNTNKFYFFNFPSSFPQDFPISNRTETQALRENEEETHSLESPEKSLLFFVSRISANFPRIALSRRRCSPTQVSTQHNTDDLLLKQKGFKY